MKTEINARRFFAWTVTGFLTGAIFLFSSLVVSFNSHLEGGRWVNECLQKKNAAVQQIQPRLVILSGSNSLFGFSAERFTNKHGIPTVNAAIHAGLGPNYILDYGRKYIAPGRVFVLPLEYQQYGKPSTSANGAFLYQVVGFDPDYFWNMGAIEKMQFAIGIPWIDRLRLLKGKFMPSPRNDIDGYQSRNLNAWGDETSNTLESRADTAVSKVNAMSAPQFEINEDAWEEIENFVADVRAGGGNVVLAYPNIYTKYLDTQKNSVFFSELAHRAKSIKVKLVGNPDAARYDESLLFDTPYHQNTTGQRLATDRLYNDLHAAGIF